MKKRILMFSGNSEADHLVRRLCEAGADLTVSVATDTGAEVLKEKISRDGSEGRLPFIKSGRMDKDEICEYIKSGKFDFIIDGTHPFAEEASRNIAAAAEECGIEISRLRREKSDDDKGYDDIRYFENFEDCAAFLKKTEGNIFLATGSKTLDIFTSNIDDKKRIYLRVIPTEESIKKAKESGIENSHILAMQGVFSKELNKALMREFNCRILVTKDSGKTGGFEEKIGAARECGMTSLVIRRPDEAGSLTEDEIFNFLKDKYELKKEEKKIERRIVLAGIGMGSRNLISEETQRLLKEADTIIASSSRIINPILFGNERSGRKIYTEYDPLKIADIIEDDARSERTAQGYRSTIAVVFSGDSGFYSGAEKTAAELKKRGMEFEIYPGISSISALSAKSGISWQDAHILSIHGRKADVTAAVREHKKVFLLLNDALELKTIAEELLDAGLIFTKITAGINMGSETEKIISFEASEAGGISEKGICCCFIENKACAGRRLTPGIKDDAFVRGDVPMTKEEIRIMSICRMKLKSDAVVWDIGAGTGSVTIESALLSPDIKVYAIERNPDAIDLINENIRKANLSNVSVIEGEAPEVLEGLEAPDAVFIGGSGGNLRNILKFIMHLEKHIQIVLNCVTIETVGEINATLKALPHEDEDMAMIQVTRSVKAGDHHILKSLNPVYIISFKI